MRVEHADFAVKKYGTPWMIKCITVCLDCFTRLRFVHLFSLLIITGSLMLALLADQQETIKYVYPNDRCVAIEVKNTRHNFSVWENCGEEDQYDFDPLQDVEVPWSWTPPVPLLED